MDYYSIFCDNLQFLRQLKNIEVDNLAQKLGVSAECFQKIEKGELIYTFSFEQLKVLCTEFNVTADSLLFSSLKTLKRNKSKKLPIEKYDAILKDINSTINFIDKSKQHFIKHKQEV